MGKFLIGASTAAYQVEGNNIYSDFWLMEQLPHSSFQERSGDAVDHYHRYAEDMRLMKEAGMSAYRFSIEWARIEQQRGVYCEEELLHYQKMIRCCRENGLVPIVTLHHFSSPKWLIEEGGWNSENTIEYFKNYCVYIVQRLGEDLEYVCTINEANMRMQLDMMMKTFAKKMGINIQVGVNVELPERFRIALEEQKEAFGGVDSVNTFLTGCSKEVETIVMRAHEAARDAMKAIRPELKIGLTLSIHDIQALPGGEELAEQYWDDEFNHYLPYIQKDDFLGVQNYTRLLVDENGEVPPADDVETTQMGYEFYPQSLGHVIHRVAKELDKPLLVTENGIATDQDERRFACSWIRKSMHR